MFFAEGLKIVPYSINRNLLFNHGIKRDSTGLYPVVSSTVTSQHPQHIFSAEGLKIVSYSINLDLLFDHGIKRAKAGVCKCSREIHIFFAEGLKIVSNSIMVFNQ
jgi:hypothetical protein